MILVSQIYDTLLSAIRKDKRGLSFSPDDFNNIVVQVNQRIYRLNYKNFESSKVSMDESDSFKVVKYPLLIDSNGVGILPNNYFHLVGDPYYYYTSTNRRKVELVTSLEFGNRELDYFSKSTALYPLSFMGYGATSEDMSLYCNPVADMAGKTVYIDYLRSVNTPYLDYYINNLSLNITYMAEGATVAVPLGCTSRSGVSGPANVVSLTKNFEWHEHDTPAIVNMLLEHVGISMPDELLIQVSNNDEPKIEAH